MISVPPASSYAPARPILPEAPVEASDREGSFDSHFTAAHEGQDTETDSGIQVRPQKSVNSGAKGGQKLRATRNDEALRGDAPGIVAPVLTRETPPLPLSSIAFLFGAPKGLSPDESMTDGSADSLMTFSITEPGSTKGNLQPAGFKMELTTGKSAPQQVDESAQMNPAGKMTLQVSIDLESDKAPNTPQPVIAAKANAKAATAHAVEFDGSHLAAQTDADREPEFSQHQPQAERTLPHGAQFSIQTNSKPDAPPPESAPPTQKVESQPVAPVERPETVQQTPREFSVNLSAADRVHATVHIKELAGGQLKVNVFTPDVELNKSLRLEADSLSGQLESAGIKAQVTQPGQSHGASTDTSDSQFPGSGSSGNHWRGTAGETTEDRQQRRSRWLEEMEKRNAD